MSKKAPAVHTTSEATGPRLVPGRFAPIVRIEARLASLRS